MATVFAINFRSYNQLTKIETYLEKLADQCKDGKESLFYLALPYSELKSGKPQTSQKILLGANRMNIVDPGSFTESIAVQMLTDAEAEFVLLGTEEEKTILDESPESISLKVKAALNAGLQAVIMINGGVNDPDSTTISQQIKTFLEHLPETSNPKVHLVFRADEIPGPEAISRTALEQAVKTIRKALQEQGTAQATENIKVLIAIPPYDNYLLETALNSTADGVYLSGYALETIKALQN